MFKNRARLRWLLVGLAVLITSLFGLRLAGIAWLSLRDGSAELSTNLEALEIRGSTQWVFERYREAQAPIVLFLHGGPGMPATPLARFFDRQLPQNYLVVHWDQRGVFAAGPDPHPAMRRPGARSALAEDLRISRG